MKVGRFFVLAIVVVLLGTGLAEAQSDGFAFTGINFNFTNPGARARGIGGAFVAIADDSTAALANPAGLAYLDREVSLEWIRDEEEFPVGQLTQGGVTNVQEFPLWTITPEQDPYRVRATSSSNRLNFGSVLLPLKKNRLTLALSYGVLADLESRFEVGDSVVCVDPNGVATLPGAGQACTFNFQDPASGDIHAQHFGQSVRYSMKTEVLGAALGYRLGDRWSVGAQVGMGMTDFNGRAEIDRSSAGIDNGAEVSTGSDEDILFTLGVLYRADRWGFGLSWRSDSKYDIDNAMLDETGNVDDDVDPFSGELTVPGRAAIGVAFYPSDSWVIAAEVTQIPYSNVLSKMTAFRQQEGVAGIRYRIEDVTEYHLGAEYTQFTDKRGWSVRAGWWRDTTHLPFVNESYGNPRDENPDVAAANLARAVQSLVRAPFKEDVDHFTLGVGLSSGVVRMDAAIDWTDNSGTDFLVSGVVYF
jgi:long-subunit fatty acid transport protein